MTQIQENKDPFQSGRLMLLDKPYEWTSFDVVNKIKSLLRYKHKIRNIKIGHAGTLDPLATGLLIICTGKLTKQIAQYLNLDKTYTGTFYLGKTTPSFDLETPVDKEYPISHINDELINKTAEKFIGNLQQIPPLYSAKKIQGKRAYKFARNGKQKTLDPVNINVISFKIIRVELPEVDFKITCSKGFYIRSLARDFGFALHSGAYLKSLRRISIGEFSVEEAYSIQNFEKSLLNVK